MASSDQDDRGVAVSLRGLRKAFGSAAGGVVRAVDGVDLDVHDGEFFSMLGPSGSGKTTVLRMIAGFERPTAGQIMLGGLDVTGRPPFERDVNTVFQDYALFPHYTVLENVAYGLRVKGVPKAQRRERAGQALDAVRLAGFGGRKPAQLSGGQRQRVALARALVNRPRVLLLDEPLGALDLKLREEMQLELKTIQREVGITFVLVTHDQEEALTMSDRVAVFNAGRIEQVATPSELYQRPATAFVAGFVGISNLLQPAAARALIGADGVYSIRPEKLRVTICKDAEAAGTTDTEPQPDGESQPDGENQPDGESNAAGVIRDVIFAGAVTRLIVSLEVGGEIVALGHNVEFPGGVEPAALRDRKVQLSWRREDAYRLPAPTSDSAEPTVAPVRTPREN